MTDPRLLMACAVVLTGCAPIPRQVPAKTAPAQHAISDGASERARELLESQCSACHDDPSNGRPRFGRVVPLDPKLALWAASLIAAERMPPPPATLDDPSRARLLDALCKVGAKDPVACLHAYGPLATPFMRAPLELLRAVGTVAPPTPSSAPVEDMVRRSVPEATRAFRQNVTLEALVVLLAAGRCPAPTGTTESAERFERCAASILDPRLVQIPAPGPSGRD